LGIIVALLQAVSWAGTGILLKPLAVKYDAFLVNGIGGLGQIPMTNLIFLIGNVLIGGVLGDALCVVSLKHLGVSRGFPITNSYPVFTVLFSFLILGTGVNWSTIVGMVIVLLGVYLIARPNHVTSDIDQPPLDLPKLIKGVLLALSSAALWGLGTVLLSIGLRGINPVLTTTIRAPLVAIFSFLVVIGRGHLGELKRIDRQSLWLLLATGILGWGVGAVLYSAAVQLLGPSKTAIIGATSPLFAAPLSWLFLHERPTRYTVLGTVLTVVGIVLVA